MSSTTATSNIASTVSRVVFMLDPEDRFFGGLVRVKLLQFLPNLGVWCLIWYLPLIFQLLQRIPQLPAPQPRPYQERDSVRIGPRHGVSGDLMGGKLLLHAARPDGGQARQCLGHGCGHAPGLQGEDYLVKC